jgi:hypothetical protein
MPCARSRAQASRAVRGGRRGEGGAITRAQAQAAGLGYVAAHFDAIDRAAVGVRSFRGREALP